MSVRRFRALRPLSAVGRTATRNTKLFISAGSAVNFTRGEVSRLLPRAVTGRTFLGGEKWMGWDFDGIFSDEG
jgi:hypothetical protein